MKTLKPFFMTLIVGLLALQLSACAWLKRAIDGTETLEDQKVTSLELKPVGHADDLCAGGAPMQLQVCAQLEDKPALCTWAYGPDGQAAKKGHLAFDEFQFTSSVGQVGPEGMLKVPNLGLALLGRLVDVSVGSAHQPGLSAKTSLPMHFGCPQLVNGNGQHGSSGSSGSPGRSGSHGQGEQSSGSYAKPGGHGQNGERGGPGGHGEDGTPGHRLTVDLAKIQSPQGAELVLVRVTDHTDGDRQYSLLLDPSRGARLKVLANGGAGGQGGNGGNGGSVGSGGTGSPPGNGGDGGDGGDAGSGGKGADGGAVTLRHDPRHPDLAQLVEVENAGGAAGPAGYGGSAGSGGYCNSGAQQGRSGQRGRDGQRSGQSGQAGPPASVQTMDAASLFGDLGDLKLL